VGMSERDLLIGDASEGARKYVASLPELIAKSVKDAEDKLAPANVMLGHEREEHLSFNRRYFMKDGKVGWNPGKLNPRIEKPAGPIDPDVFVMYFEGPEKRPLASYVNFAMHPDTTGGTQISADYPYALSTILGRVKGEGMVTLFANGTCGDINHVDVSTKDPQKGTEEAWRLGTILAGDVIKSYGQMKAVEMSTPRVRSEVLKLPLAQINPGDVEHARQIAVKFGKDAPTFLERVNAFKILDVYARQGKPIEAEVQVMALGDDVAVVGLPGEIFVELGLYIKANSPFKNTMIAELANGSVGYVPTRRAMAEGNYEPVSARVGVGSGEMLAETAVKLLKELKK